MWQTIRTSNSIWFIDATGSIIKDVVNQKRPYLYSIVMHDKSRKTIVPYAQFLTTSHTAENIGRSFLSIKEKSPENTFPTITVTDFSTTLMKAVLQIFNMYSVLEYLKWAFGLLIRNPKSERLYFEMKTILILCCTHFLVKFIQKCDEVNSVIPKSKKILFIVSLYYKMLPLFQK